MPRVKKQLALADEFAEESENDQSCNGFSSCELSDYDDNVSFLL